jgi:hypothetical protein
VIVPIAAKAHHRAHIQPVAELLGLDTVMARSSAQSADDVALIASYGDLKSARRGSFRRIILMQHGAGQSYGGDRRAARHPCYAGGDDNEDVGLFLVPNEHAAGRWQERYPKADVEIVGCPRLDTLPSRVSMGAAATVDEASPVVAVSFHWDGYACPEWRSAFAWYRSAVVALSKEVTVIGHGHPNRRDLPKFYAQHGIEYVPDFDDVLRRADVYACDNSSTLYEFASTARPVVVLNAPWYREEANHGLRFWDAADVGPSVEEPNELAGIVEFAFESMYVLRRERALDIVYAYRTGAAQRAADAIAAWAGVEVAA